MAESNINDISGIVGDAQPEIKSNNKENDLVQQLRGGLEQAKGFLLEELIKIGTASTNKTIGVNDDNVKQAVQSLIYADPDDPKNKAAGGGALSIIATIKDNEKKIKEWIGKGYDSKAFNEIGKEMQGLPDQLQKKLSTQEGIDNLINERVKNSILKQIPFFIDENNNIRGVNAIEKNNIISKINKDIEISPTTVSTLLQDKNLLNPLIGQVTKNANEFFGKEGAAVNNACVLDEKKLTPENILKFTEAANHTIKTFELMQQGLKNLVSGVDIAQNQKITETLLPVISNNIIPEKLEQSGTQIIKNIAPILKDDKLAEVTKLTLSKLDTGYITKHGDTIVNGLQEISNNGTTFWEKIKSIFTGKDYLKEKLEKLVDSHISGNNEYIKDKITTFSKGLNNNQLVEGLTHFINENKNAITNNPQLQNINPNEIHNNKSALVELRKINPRGFDKTVFEDSKQFGSSSKPQEVKVKPPVATPNLSTKNQNKEIG